MNQSARSRPGTTLSRTLTIGFALRGVTILALAAGAVVLGLRRSWLAMAFLLILMSVNALRTWRTAARIRRRSVRSAQGYHTAPRVKGSPSVPKFTIVMRGYDIKEVDELVDLVEGARDDPREGAPSTDPRQALEMLRSRESECFRMRFRGYAVIQVQNYIEQRIWDLSGRAI